MSLEKLDNGDFIYPQLFDKFNNLVDEVSGLTMNSGTTVSGDYLPLSSFTSYSANTLNLINEVSATTQNQLNTKLNNSDFNGYSSNTQTNINNKLNITTFNSYTANTSSNSGNTNFNPSSSTIGNSLTLLNQSINTGDTINIFAGKTQGQLDNINKLIKHLTNTKLTKSGRYSNRRVGSFARVNNRDVQSNGTDTSQTSRLKFYNAYFLNEISLIYNNDWAYGSTNTTGDSITIEVSLEYPAGTFKRITFNGANSVVIPYGTQVECDPIGVTIPNNTYYWIRTYTSVTAGQRWINTHATDAGYTEGVVLNTNSVVSGTITNSTTNCFGPSVIFGSNNNKRYSFFCTGDSIAFGVGDSGFTSMGFTFGGGLFGRTLGPTSATIHTQIPGGGVAGFITNRGRRLLDLASTCDFHLSNYGTNDISGGATFATVAQNLCNLWFLVLSKGIKSYHSTILPRTNVSNVPIATEPVRLQVNAWLRDGAPIDIDTQTYAVVGSSGASIVRVGDLLHPVIYIFELAYLAEASPDSGTWKPGYTADGIHPNSTGYIAINVGYTDISFLDKF